MKSKKLRSELRSAFLPGVRVTPSKRKQYLAQAQNAGFEDFPSYIRWLLERSNDSSQFAPPARVFTRKEDRR